MLDNGKGSSVEQSGSESLPSAEQQLNFAVLAALEAWPTTNRGMAEGSCSGERVNLWKPWNSSPHAETLQQTSENAACRQLGE